MSTPVLPSASAPAETGLPPHVRTAFGVADAPPRPVLWAGRRAWLCGEVLIRPVSDNAAVAWSSSVLETLQVDGVRLARPVRSTDGRWVVGGWAACRFVPGGLLSRYDAVLDAGDRLHDALAAVPRPRLLDGRDDLLTRSAAGAFGEARPSLDPARGGDLYDRLLAQRAPIRLVPQVVHPELFGAVLFDEAGNPVLTDLVPCWRPREWAVAVVVVDAVAWGGADAALLQHGDRLDEWPQMLLRAVLHRLALHAQHPSATPASLHGLERAAGLVAALL